MPIVCQFEKSPLGSYGRYFWVPQKDPTEPEKGEGLCLMCHSTPEKKRILVLIGRTSPSNAEFFHKIREGGGSFDHRICQQTKKRIAPQNLRFLRRAFGGIGGDTPFPPHSERGKHTFYSSGQKSNSLVGE